jgi:hypothetical protein
MTVEKEQLDSPATFESALEDLFQRAVDADLAVEGGWECKIEDGQDLDVLVTRIAGSD